MKLYRSFDILGVDKWMKPNSLYESGKIHCVKNKAEELGMTPIELISTKELVEDIEYRYECNLRNGRARFIEKYKEYL